MTYVVKNSFGPLFKKRVTYDPSSGKIIGVSNYSEYQKNEEITL